MVQRAGIPIIDTKFVTIGGGIGSFVTVDFLRIYGVPRRTSPCSPSWTRRGRATST